MALLLLTFLRRKSKVHYCIVVYILSITMNNANEIDKKDNSYIHAGFALNSKRWA